MRFTKIWLERSFKARLVSMATVGLIEALGAYAANMHATPTVLAPAIAVALMFII